jgi:hypothetical protein
VFHQHWVILLLAVEEGSNLYIALQIAKLQLRRWVEV